MSLQVLIVEDSEDDAALIARTLERAGHELFHTRVDDEEGLRTALREIDWDLVISDWSMPTLDALRTLAIVNEHKRDVPVIIVSGTVGEDNAVEAMRAGAQDFVVKERLARLVPAVERELREREHRRSHRRAEQALGESEARFARLAESGIIGIAYADLHGHLKEANDAYLAMIGYTREEFTHELTWPMLNPPEQPDQDETIYQQLARTGAAGPWEQEVVHKDGRRVPVLIGVAMLDETNCISFVADLTERKRTEAALHRSEEQLRQAQKMEAIGLLAGGVAHDFNNLLSVILAYCGVAISSLPEDAPLRGDLTEVYRAGERAAELTRQLLAFSRRQVLQPRALDLCKVVGAMANMLRPLIGEDVELVLDRADHVDLVQLDKGQIEQVIMNLAVNARDAMPRGGKLTISVNNVQLSEAFVADHVGTAVGAHVELCVRDSGHGIDPETQIRIFEPFFTTKEVRGTGLGLSTVLGIVEQSGGTIWVSSEVGLGTSFELYFPVRAGTAVEPRVEPTHHPVQLGGYETVLLVEDDPQVRTLASTILRRNGYRVLEAPSGGDALLAGEQHKGDIALLLTDVVMPRLSGRELTIRLRAQRPDLRTLYMSGYTDDAVLRHGVLESDVAFLQKPFTADSLLRKVRETLDESSRRAP